MKTWVRNCGMIFLLAMQVLLSVPSLYAQEKDTKKQEDNARKFAFGTINFSMTLDEFKKEFPGAIKGQATNEKINYYQYSIDDPRNVASWITVWFFDGKLLELCIGYNKNLDRRLEKIGGAKVLLQRLEEKFGTFRPSNSSEDRVKNETRIRWPMPAAERVIILIETGFEAKIHVGDTALYKRLNARKSKKADVGF
jgi:hypothetical protein